MDEPLDLKSNFVTRVTKFDFKSNGSSIEIQEPFDLKSNFVTRTLYLNDNHIDFENAVVKSAF